MKEVNILEGINDRAFTSGANQTSTAIVLILFILLVLVTSAFFGKPALPGDSGIASADNERNLRLYNSTNILDIKYLGYSSDALPSTSVAVNTTYIPFYDAFVPQIITYGCFPQNVLGRYARLSYEIIYPTGEGEGKSYGSLQIRLRYDNCASGGYGWADVGISNPYVSVELLNNTVARITRR
ncbi:hypothetical protein SAMN05444162_1330 [Paenibacillaceae bacterium GAS479]|nr:hypothetical protein SAMN05444162_1330 [Paenibacillaceae bacterium GAS479]